MLLIASYGSGTKRFTLAPPTAWRQLRPRCNRTDHGGRPETPCWANVAHPDLPRAKLTTAEAAALSSVELLTVDVKPGQVSSLRLTFDWLSTYLRLTFDDLRLTFD